MSPGVKPASLQSFARLLVFFIVAPHDVWAPGQDLAVRSDPSPRLRGWGFPTVPNFRFSKVFTAITGEDSVSP